MKEGDRAVKPDTEQTQKLKKEEGINNDSGVDTKQVGEPERLAVNPADTLDETL